MCSKSTGKNKEPSYISPAMPSLQVYGTIVCQYFLRSYKTYKSLNNNELPKFSHAAVPVGFEVVALEDIPADTELYWCYKPEHQQVKSKISSVDFKSKHLKREHTPEDLQKIKKIMAEAFTDSLKVTTSETFEAITKQRIINLNNGMRNLKFNHDEKMHYEEL